MILCVKCFTEGKFPTILSEKDFIKMDLISKLASSDSQRQKAAWSTDDTLKLLELIENHGDNWNEILKAMGQNRTREEIVLHFLQLPLKNIASVHLFENGEQQKQSKNKLCIDKIADQEPNVFSDYSNPLLQHVAIFKSLLDKYREEKTKPK